MGKLQCDIVATAGHARPTCMLLLLEAGAEKDAQDVEGRAPLHFAASNGNRDCVALLIQHGADPDLATLDFGATALHIAAQNGHAEVVFLLIGVGLDVDRAETSATGGTGLSSLCGPFGSCTRAD